MTTYFEYGVKLTDGQKSKLASAILNKSPLTLRLKHSHLRGSDELMLTKRQISKIKKSIANGTGSDIKISKTQIRRSVKHGGNLFSSLASLGAKVLPYAIKGVSKVVPALATGAATALGEIGLNKIFGKGITIPKQFFPMLPPLVREFTQSQINQINKAHQTGGRLIIKPTHNVVEYFDPFGLIMPNEALKYFHTSGKRIVYSTDEIQNRNTVLCGYWCLYYLYERQRGNSILNVIHNPHFDNDNSDFIKAYFGGYFSNWKWKKEKKKVKKLISPSEGAGVFDTVVGTAVDGFVHYGLPWMGKKAVEMGRYGASELMRNKNLQKKAVNYGISKLTPFIQDSVGTAMDQLSTKVRPNKKYKTDKPKLDGRGLDIHNAILKVAPSKGFVLPGHNYTGPGNPLHKQLRHDDKGNILEIFQQPTGPTDAVSMQHDVDYTVCGNKPKSEQVKCKNEADKKMIKSLDAIPLKERQWG
ncbi:unnamed protein product, partial [Porites evermanni]